MIAIVLLCCVVGVSANWRILEDFCESTKIADHLENWCSETIDFCEWQGLSCEEEELRAIEISNVPLNIELPDSFYGPPSSVRKVVMKNCGFTGKLKEATQMLDFLTLDLSDNNLEGELPYRFVTQFMHLNVANNDFVGEAGLCKSDMKRVGILTLSDNRFEEDLSACTATQWPDLKEFSIGGNLFYGTAPAPYNTDVYNISSNKFFAIRNTALKEIEPVPGFTLPASTLEKLRFRLCDTSGNPFTTRSPAWMKTHETECGYEWNSLNTRYKPTTTTTTSSTSAFSKNF